MVLNKTKFTTEITLRPDDIDLNNHLHSSKYMDYVLFARYDQMERCYGFSMEQFVSAGYSWVMTDCFMQFKRPLFLNDMAEVTTWVEELNKNNVEVHFLITNKKTKKRSCGGWFKYAMIDLATQRSTQIPAEIIQKYSI